MGHTRGQVSLDLMEGYEDGTDPVLLDANGFPIAIIEACPILHNWREKYPDMKHWGAGADDGWTQRIRPREEYESNAKHIKASWDFCTGFKPEALEAVRLGALVNASTDVLDALEGRVHSDSAVSALKRLREITDHFDTDTPGDEG